MISLHDLRKFGLARNSMLSLFQSAIGIVVYFLVMRYVIKTAGLEGVGLWSLTTGFVALARLFDLSGTSGLPRIVAMKVDNDQERIACIDSVSILAASFFIVLGLASYFPLRTALAAAVDVSMAPIAETLLLWVILALPINMVGIAQMNALDGLGRSDIRSVISIIGFLSFAILAVAFISRYGILGLAYAQFAQHLFILVATRVCLSKSIGGLTVIPRIFRIHAIREILSYSLRLQAARFPLALFDPMTRILLARWVGLEYLGVYDLSYKLAAYVRMMIRASLQPMLPEFARLQETDLTRARSSHARITGVIILVTIAAYTTLILASPLVSLFLLSEVSYLFIFSVSVLSLAWGAATFGLPTQQFAHAAGTLKWSILGQWSLIVLGAVLAYATHQWLGEFWIAAGIAIAIATGNLLACAGETLMHELNPIGASSKLLIVLSITAFFLLGGGVVLISIYMQNTLA